MGFAKQKLKTNLKLAINRLKLLEKKKTELAQKARKEIADYISNGKDERARIRVEHIIREDFLVEALELLELYCDLLLARFGLIETMSYCDEGMIEAVTTIIWAAPRLQTDIQEFKIISDQLGYKYGKKFGHEASTNCNGTVNTRLIQKLSPNPPPKILVERYLIEIARSHHVEFEPDPSVMASEEDLDFQGGPPGGGSYVGPPGGGSYGGPPGGGSYGGPPGGGSYGGGGGGGGIGFENFGNPGGKPIDTLPSIPAMTGGNPGMAYPPPSGGVPPYPPAAKGPPPPDAAYPPAARGPSPSDAAYPTPQKFNPYPPEVGAPSNPPSNPPKAAGPPNPPAPSAPPAFPDLPSVPSNSLPSGSIPGASSGGGEDVDFDDLTRRFEELKKRK
ncbi:IST1 homolog isoform X2 [Exaiptasia diaphana]|uniref:IST1 homolog n=1 Tax=Exaiptasia diaphana TaxID=2652724 RepID=A0A913XNC4_EXADI|nr:IST1 homolog isoform X2 [Exaiptasia diaphana]